MAVAVGSLLNITVSESGIHLELLASSLGGVNSSVHPHALPVSESVHLGSSHLSRSGVLGT